MDKKTKTADKYKKDSQQKEKRQLTKRKNWQTDSCL